MSIQIDDLAATVQKELRLYSDKVNEAVKVETDEVAKEAAKELNNSAPKRTGAYAKNWTVQNQYESKRAKRNTVYNNKRYQLTHLLEKGHALRNGGRVSPKMHIAPVEQRATEQLEKRIKEAVQE